MQISVSFSENEKKKKFRIGILRRIPHPASNIVSDAQLESPGDHAIRVRLAAHLHI